MNKNKTLVPALALSLVVASTGFAASANGQKNQGATNGPRSQVTTPGCEEVMNPAYEPKQPVRSQPSQRGNQRNTQRNNQNWNKDQAMENCPVAPPAPCYSFEEPVCENCLGPENVAGNPAVNPITCNGDIIITASGLYWTARADGLESAIETAVFVPPTTTSGTGHLNNLIDAEFIHLPGKWDPGFKIGVGYASTYDGWDVGILWTSFTNHASKDITQLPDDNHVLLPLWSGFSSNIGTINNVLWATQIESDWRLRLNIADAEVGREFWNSKYLTLRPFIGLRYTWINQKYTIQYRGGSWSNTTGSASTNNATNDEVSLKNDFNGIGIRGGLSSNWYLGRGFAIFGSGAVSIVYGRFSLSGDEDNRLAAPPFTSAPIAEWEQGYRSSKAMTDLQIGLEWNTLLGDCGYGFTFAVAWEHHMFFNQNQLWTIAREGGFIQSTYPNNTGSNVIDQRNGDVATQGWTFTAAFQF